MPFNPAEFRAACDAAVRWLDAASLIGWLGEEGELDDGSRVDDVYHQLLLPSEGRSPPGLWDTHERHGAVLVRLREELAAHSDAPVKWERGRGTSGIFPNPNYIEPERWHSALEAAEGIARKLLAYLVWPLVGIDDPATRRALAQRLLAERWKALAITTEEAADLKERIGREQAKLLREMGREAEGGGRAKGARRGKRGRKLGGNLRRNKWLTAQRKKGMTYETIAEVAIAKCEAEGWDVLGSGQAVQAAIESYAEHLCRRKEQS